MSEDWQEEIYSLFVKGEAVRSPVGPVPKRRLSVKHKLCVETFHIITDDQTDFYDLVTMAGVRYLMENDFYYREVLVLNPTFTAILKRDDKKGLKEFPSRWDLTGWEL
jgi:hypothetical protein